MNTASTHETRRPFARVIDSVVAFFAECNYAWARMYGLENPLPYEPSASRPASRPAA